MKTLVPATAGVTLGYLARLFGQEAMASLVWNYVFPQARLGLTYLAKEKLKVPKPIYYALNLALSLKIMKEFLSRNPQGLPNPALRWTEYISNRTTGPVNLAVPVVQIAGIITGCFLAFQLVKESNKAGPLHTLATEGLTNSVPEEPQQAWKGALISDLVCVTGSMLAIVLLLRGETTGKQKLAGVVGIIAAHKLAAKISGGQAPILEASAFLCKSLLNVSGNPKAAETHMAQTHFLGSFVGSSLAGVLVSMIA
jgi:hypothetical protein